MTNPRPVENLPAPAEPPLSFSVIVCAFADERLDDTVRCVESALAQSPPPAEVIVVIDHNPGLAAELSARLPKTVTVTANAGKNGLSSARNTGIDLAGGDVIAFLDDDAVAHPGWLATLEAAFADAAVVGAGGKAVASWDQGQPSWFPDEFLWVVGCSYAGQPVTGEVRNPLGCNMAFRAEVFANVGKFDTQIGRLGKRPLGCEETELCIRVRRSLPDAKFVLVSGADIDHRVPQVRGEPAYLIRRCYYEGISKALVRTLGDTQSLDTERAYVSRALPLALLRSVARGVTGPDRVGALGRIAAVIGGLTAAACGYAVGAVSFRNRRVPDRSVQ
jgi:glycosyltransferase involved in cell wall biosynthesis